MNVLLVNAPTFGAHMLSAPLGLLYIAACTKRAGHTVRVVDGCLCADRRELANIVCGEPFDVVGIASLTNTYPAAVALARTIKKRHPSALIVLGGVHATVLPLAVMEDDCFDYAIVGEADEAFPRLVDALDGASDPSAVRGVVSRPLPAIAPPPVVVHDIDNLPWPARDLLPRAPYSTAPHGLFYRKWPFTSAISSRGCPYDCSFCSCRAVHGDLWRPRDPEAVVAEISSLRRQGFREVHFEDDVTVNQARLIELCDRLRTSCPDLTWKCADGCRADRMTPELARAMRRAGCYSVAFGIESANPAVLSAANKRLDLDRAQEGIAAAREAGLHTVGFFMLGLPGETAESLERTVRYACSLPLDTAQFNFFVPFPGTRALEQVRRLGSVPSQDWARYDVDCVVDALPGLSRRVLRRARRAAFLRFYLSRGRLWRNVQQLQARTLVRGFAHRVRRVVSS